MRLFNRTIPALLAAALGCAGENAGEQTATGDSLPQTGSYYTQGADSLQMEGTASDDALTAPAIIAPMRLELDRMRANPGAWLEANSTGHKFLLSDLIAAMQADMTRLGISDTEDLRTLGDSAIEALGGGTGIADALDVESVPAHADRVEWIITLYESKLRSSQGAAQAASDIADTAR